MTDDSGTQNATIQTLEAYTAELQARLLRSETDTLRQRIVAHFNLADSTHQLLTGTDEATLMLQGERLQQMASAYRTLGNVAPREGTYRETGRHGDQDMREFTSTLFGSDPDA